MTNTKNTKHYRYGLVLDDWKIIEGICKGKDRKAARTKLYERLKKKGFKSMRGQLTETLTP